MSYDNKKENKKDLNFKQPKKKGKQREEAKFDPLRKNKKFYMQQGYD